MIKLKELINEEKIVLKRHQANEITIDEGVIEDLLKKLVDKLSRGDEKVVKQLSKKDPKFLKSYKQFLKARSSLEASLRANKGMWSTA